MLRLKLITPPTIEPVTAELAGTYARVNDLDADRETLELMVSTAREQAEQRGRVFLTQTWEAAYDYADLRRDGRFRSSLELPLAPVQSVATVTVYDEDSVGTVLTAGEDYEFEDGEPGTIAWLSTSNFPTELRRLRTVVVRFVAGYGDAAEDIPASVRMALLKIVSTLYEYREDVSAGVGNSVASIPLNAAVLLDSLRLWKL